MSSPSTGEALKTQADKRTQPVDVSHPSLPTILDLEQGTCELSGLSGRDGGYTWAQQEGLTFIKANLTNAASECPTCQQQRLVLENTHHLLGDYILGPFQPGRASGLSSPGIDTYSGYGFTCSAPRTSASITTIQELMGYLMHIMEFHITSRMIR